RVAGGTGGTVVAEVSASSTNERRKACAARHASGEERGATASAGTDRAPCADGDIAATRSARCARRAGVQCDRASARVGGLDFPAVEHDVARAQRAGAQLDDAAAALQATDLGERAVERDAAAARNVDTGCIGTQRSDARECAEFHGGATAAPEDDRPSCAERPICVPL